MIATGSTRPLLGPRAATALLAATATLCLGAAESRANVSINNGNFFVGFTDLKVDPAIAFVIERIYNSRTGRDGVFGIGWGSDFEVYLSLQADGSVVVHENGGGANNVFDPLEVDPTEIERQIDRLVALRGDPQGRASYREELRNARYRHDEWDRAVGEGLVPATVAPRTGTRLRSLKFGVQELVKLPDGWSRRFDDGRSQLFDDEGRLLRVTTPTGRFIDVERDDGRITRLTDDHERRAEFSYDERGYLRAIRAGDQTATYEFDSSHSLVAVENSDGRYRFTYDQFSNMTRIGYADGTDMRMEFSLASRTGQYVNASITGLKLRDDTNLVFHASPDDLSGPHTTHTVRAIVAGQPIRTLSYEFHYATTSNGQSWIDEQTLRAEGYLYHATFDRHCGRVRHVERDGEVVEYEYDEDGRLVRKTLDRARYQFRYNGFGRLARVTMWSRPGRKSRFRLRLAVDYTPDRFGRPIAIRTSRLQHYGIEYGKDGEVSRVTANGRVLPSGRLTAADGTTAVNVRLIGEPPGATADPFSQARARWGIDTGVCDQSDSVPDLRPAGLDLGL